jgi:hypothetical protein
MRLTIFYSWQSDRPSKLCRDFIHIALKDAAERLAARREVEVVVDSDTQGIPGTPPITAVILEKIEACDVFIADMSFVAETAEANEAGETKLLPNPNVMGEFGFALSEKGWRRILLVMNEAYGPAKALPFDLGHFRKPATYNVATEKLDAERRSARNTLSARLEGNLEAVLDDILKAPPQVGESVRRSLEDMAIATQNARSANNPPAIVSQPAATVHLVPASALGSPSLNPEIVNAARRLLYPAQEQRAQDGLDHTQWWARGPLRRVADLPNPEAWWFGRLLRLGVIEQVFTIGQRIDDDPDIGVDGRQLEGRLVEVVDRGLVLLRTVGLSGPTLVRIVLHGLEDVDLSGGPGRGRLRTPSLGLSTVLVPDGVDASASFLRSAFDDLWLASGRADASPSYGSGEWAGYDNDDRYRFRHWPT